MRTTLDLPDSLLLEAMALSHQKTKTAVIVSALEAMVRKAKISHLRQYRGKIELDVDMDILRKRQ